MKTILRTIISSTTAVIRHLFPSKEMRIKKKLLKSGDKLCRRVVVRLKAGEEFTYPSYHRNNLLHRRLKQFQQVRRQGSIHAKAAALRKLEKEWRKFQRNCRVKTKGAKIISMSSVSKHN